MSIVIEHLNYVYMQGGPYETKALDDVSLTIHDGEFIGLIGHTGSGKSTLVQHLNGLILPTSGKITVDGMDLAEKGTDRRAIRRRVGLVFQYPENQLFEETVAKDIAFGPKNLGLGEEEIDRRVRTAMRRVALDYDKLAQRSVFELSGGQMRRVAIAGVLAMEPQTLVLDEPCAGLDPRGREEILGLISDLHRESGATIVMVSHSMDDVAALAERVIVMNHGKVAMDGTPREIFSRGEELRAIGLDVPQAVELAQKLREKGFDVPEGIYKIEEVRAAVEAIVGKGGRMLNDITLGQYFPGNSVIHRMDPRMKLILTILYIVGVFIVANLPGYAIALAFLYIVVRISGIKFSYLAKGVKPLRFIIIFTFILNLFFVQGETPIFTLGFFTLTKEALSNAVYFALRLVFLVMGTSVLTLTTSPVQLTDGLERIMHPLEKIHFPAHELAMMMTIALRFIPTLLEETDKIQKAQMARGADFESGNLIERAKAMIPLLVPLFVSSFRRANELAMAMEARCYRGGDHRTRLRELKYTKLDLYGALAMAAFLIIIVAEGRLLG